MARFWQQLVLLFFCLGLASVFGQIEAVQTEAVFGLGETISFDIVITNTFDMEKEFSLVESTVTPHLETPMLVPSAITLPANSSETVEYRLLVTNEILPGDYVYSLSLFDSDELIGTADVFYTVEGTLDIFQDAYFLTCVDTECDHVKQVFVLADEQAVIKAINFDGASFTGYLTLPDNSEVPLVFIRDSAVANIPLAGLYKATVTAEQEGFRPMEKEIEFEVITEGLILAAPSCNVDAVCDADETVETCPTDCLEEEVEAREREAAEAAGMEGVVEALLQNIHWLVAAAIILLVFFWRIRKK